MSEATWKRRFRAPTVMFVVDERIKQVAMEIAFVAKHLGTTPPQP